MKNDPTKSKRYHFILEHRGGPLTKAQQKLMIKWSINCVEHIIPLFSDNQLFNEEIDQRVFQALETAKAWEKEQVSTGTAMKAALAAHAAAREASHPALIALARAAGQAVSTAHSADHSMGGAIYSIKALDALINSPQKTQIISKEKAWQIKKLPREISKLIKQTLPQKSAFFRCIENS